MYLKKLSNHELKEIKQSIPGIIPFLKGDDSQLNSHFFSVFNHWLDESESHIIQDTSSTILNERRKRFFEFLHLSYSSTSIYLTRYKRKNKPFIYRPSSFKHLIHHCGILNQTGLTGKRYQLIYPAFKLIICEEYDWTSSIWVHNSSNLESIVNIVKQSGLHMLKTSR